MQTLISTITADNIDQNSNDRKNLAPIQCRQRVIIESLVSTYISKEQLETYLTELSKTIGMTPVDGPYIYSCGELGFGGRIHRTTSGAHIYTYPPEKNKTPFYLLTVDAYTCKPFSLEQATNFTKDFFDTQEIVSKEV